MRLVFVLRDCVLYTINRVKRFFSVQEHGKQISRARICLGRRTAGASVDMGKRVR